MQFRVFKGNFGSALITLFYFILIADLPMKMTWRRCHFLRQGGSRESDVALSHSPPFPFVISVLFCRFRVSFSSQIPLTFSIKILLNFTYLRR